MANDPVPDTYQFDLARDAWICFHCGERFSVAAQGCYDSAVKAAREHFGDGGYEGGDEPLCKLAMMPNADLAKRLREAETAMREAFDERDRTEEEAAGAHQELASIGSRFKARTVYDAWCMFDSMEGRALAAEAIIAEIAKTQPELVEQAREAVCRPSEQVHG
jgi:hypothetical protein